MPHTSQISKLSEGAFSPLSLQGLALWLDAADASTITLNGNNVSQWNDKGPNALHVSQGTSANQPPYVTGAQNGRNAVSFATNKVLTRGSVTSGLLAAADEMTLLVAQRYDATSNGTILYYPGTTDALLNFNLRWSDNNFYCDFQNGTTGRLSGAAPGNFDNVWNIVSYQRRKDNSADLQINGLRTLSGTLTNTGFGQARSATFCIGAQTVTNYLTGRIGEIILCRRALGTDERSLAERYLRMKWGI